MDSDNEVNSLYSTEEEGEDGKAYFVKDVLAEKQDSDGKAVWLVSWEGYDSDYHMWLPEENFDDHDTLKEWREKKQMIDEGLLPEYNWRLWEKRQLELKTRRARESTIRRQKRELRRAELGAVKRKGKWRVLDVHRRGNEGKRYLSDDSYSDGGESPTRPSKRKVVSDADSDSDDDKPLAPLAKSQTATAREESVSSSLSQTFALPIRSSQSPFPPERPSVGLQKPMETSVSSGRTYDHTAQKDTRTKHGVSRPPSRPIDVPQQSAVQKPAPPRQPPPGIMNAVSSNTHQIVTESSPALKPHGAPNMMNVSKQRKTAIRSSIPKSQQQILNIPKRIIDKKPRRKSVTATIDVPMARDFYSKASRGWNHPPRDRDSRQPDTSNMTLMNISMAAQNTSVPSYRQDRQQLASAPGDTRQGDMSKLETSNPGSSRQPAPGPIADRTSSVEQPKTVLQQTHLCSPSQEPSLFVADSQDVTMEDVPDSVHSAAESSDIPGELRRPAQADTMAGKDPVPMAVDHDPNESLTKGIAKSVPALTRKVTGDGNSLTTLIHLNGAHNVPVGELAFLDRREKGPLIRSVSPTYLILKFSSGQGIHVQVKDFAAIEHHELLQMESRSAEDRVFRFEQECLLFADFLKKYERKGENMFFSAGQIELNRRFEHSNDLLKKLKNAAVFSGQSVSLLIWPAEDIVWSPVTARFINPKSQFGVIMFLPASKSSPESAHELSSKVAKKLAAPETSAQHTIYLSTLGLQAINQVYTQPLTLDQKKEALKQIFARPEAFATEMAPEQKRLLLHQFLQTLSLTAPATTQEQISENPSRPMSDARQAVPEASRRQSQAISAHDQPEKSIDSRADIAMAQSPSSKVISSFPFDDFRKRFMENAPYKKDKAIEIFQKELGIDWTQMTRHHKQKIYVLVCYPAKVVTQEMEVLKEFLELLRVTRVYFYNPRATEDWQQFSEAMKPIIWYHNKAGQSLDKEHYDPKRHVKASYGTDGVLLLHESILLTDLPPLTKRFHNPALRVFKISLGEKYLDRNKVLISPAPRIKELVKDGEHILLTDSVILHKPDEAILILDWLSTKVAAGDLIRWKVYVRPRVADWLEKLISFNANRPGTSNKYRELYARVTKLMPEEYNSCTYEGEWLLNSNSALESDNDLEGYKHSVGLGADGNLVANLEYNAYILIEWFASVTQIYQESIRLLSIVIGESDEFGFKAAEKWKRVHLYSTEKFVETFVKPAMVKAQWRKENPRTPTSK